MSIIKLVHIKKWIRESIGESKFEEVIPDLKLIGVLMLLLVLTMIIILINE